MKGTMEIQITDHTVLFRKYNIPKFIKKVLEYIPSSDLINIYCIEIYDDVPDHFKFSMQGGYYPPSEGSGSKIVIFVDPTTHYMLRIHKKPNIFTGVLDNIFMNTIGKRFIVSTLFHEIGHHVFTIKKADYYINKIDKIEEFADNYGGNMYRDIYPLNMYYYDILNDMYHIVYKSRIEKAKGIRIVHRCGITTG